MSVFACYRVDDGAGPYGALQRATAPHGFWLRDMRQRCFSGTHRALALPIGIVSTALLVVLPPLAGAHLLWRHRCGAGGGDREGKGQVCECVCVGG